ncbi:hypothetical protein CANINC_003318 [Pichia inconspicua]|uniref:Uncharacterized protein n=1 Tax=Pichia inconspicua TaxID=52247 RepID=A0A4T0WZ09_9ASCO|nr:hypothetical protein CANINC_003318 [[Candida] inconspicua]
MVNTDSTDFRIRLDCRTGSSVVQFPDFFDSRIKELNSGKCLDEINYNSYLSSECFRLSLINRKWHHYKLEDSSKKPSARMFHSMAVHDNYIYVMGGLRFDTNNQFEILNDVWRFDTIDKIWKCYFPNGNDIIIPRYDHISFVLDSCELFEASMIHPGLCFAGGANLENGPISQLQLLDIFDEKSSPYTLDGLTEFQYCDGEVLCKHKSVNLRKSTNSVSVGSCPVSNDSRLVAFDKTSDVGKFEPFIVFDESSAGSRLNHSDDFDSTDVNSISFPDMGVFGDCAIVCGYSEQEMKMLSYVHNIKSGNWTKLHISCLHKVYSHRLTRGFVWESHHKLAFLGSMNMAESSGSIDYFENLVIMSLPFTNFYSIQPAIKMKKSRTNTPGSSGSSILSGKNEADVQLMALTHVDAKKRFDSVISGISTLSQNRNNNSSNTLPNLAGTSNSNIHTHNTTPLQHSNDHSGGFAGYAYHVAQQIQINSIRSVLPPYAIAIGKSAFERYNSLSDFDLLCSDGSIISVPLALCRRRWGDGFDELFSGAYAKAFIEGKAHDLMSSSASTCGSGDSYETSSILSKVAMATPYFRYPFQEKGENATSQYNNPYSPFHMHRLDASPNRGLMKSASTTSRHQSLSTAPLNRASLSLSLSFSRRNSATATSQSRHHSFSNHESRRGSSQILPSRRNSLNITVGQASRRGSALSRTSFLSSSSNSSNSNSKSLSSMKSRSLTDQLHETSPRSSSGALPISPVSTGSRHTNQNHHEAPCFVNVNFNKRNTPRNDEMSKESIAPNDIVDNSIDLDDYNEVLKKLEELDLTDIPAPTPMPTVLPDGETPMNTKENNETIRRTTDEKLAELVYGDNSEVEIDINKFNSLRLPRRLYLPYPSDTVRAIVEYLYSGQIGANWKFFPTGIQLLFATKQLNIPLLYDLVLELFFVTLGTIEGSCKSKIISHLEKNRSGESCDDIYHLLDIRGKNDLDFDLELLLEAIGNIRRDSGATISNELVINDEIDGDKITAEEIAEFERKRKASQINGVDPLYVEPTEHTDQNVDSNTTTNEGKDLYYSDLNKEMRKLSNVERVKITTATLDARGYEIIESVEDEVNSNLKDFSMESNKKEKKGGQTEKRKSKKKKKKLKEWPALKDLLNDDLPEEVGELVVELLIEVGALINDSKLMLQSLHVQELQRKVKLLRNTSEDTVTENNENNGIKGGQGSRSGIASVPLRNNNSSNSTTSSSSSSSSSGSSSSFSGSSGLGSSGNGNIGKGNSTNVSTRITTTATPPTTRTTTATPITTPIVQPSNTKTRPSAISFTGSGMSSGTLSPSTSTGPAIGNFDMIKNSEIVSTDVRRESPGLGPILSPSASITSFSSVTTAATAATASGKNASGKSKKGFFNRFRRP